MPNMFGGDQLDPEYCGRSRSYKRELRKIMGKICSSAGISGILMKKLERREYYFEDVNITRDVSRSYDWYRIDYINLKKRTKSDELLIAVISRENGIRLYYDLNDKQQPGFVIPVRDYLNRRRINFKEEFEGDGEGLSRILISKSKINL